MFLFLCPKGFSIFVLHKFSLCFYQVILKSVRVCVCMYECVCACVFCICFALIFGFLSLPAWDCSIEIIFLFCCFLILCPMRHWRPLPSSPPSSLSTSPFVLVGCIHATKRRGLHEGLGERAASSFTFGHFIVIAEIPSMALAIFVPFKFYFVACVAAHGNCDLIVLIDSSLIYPRAYVTSMMNYGKRARHHQSRTRK